MAGDETNFYTNGVTTIESIDSSSFDSSPSVEGLQGLIDGSPMIGETPMNIYDLYVLMAIGGQKKVNNLGYPIQYFHSKSGTPHNKTHLQSDDIRLRTLSFTAEAVRQFLTAATGREVLYIPQVGGLKAHSANGPPTRGAHPWGLAWDHGDGINVAKSGFPTFFFADSKKALSSTQVVAATAVCMDQGIILEGRLGMYENGNVIDNMHYDYLTWRTDNPGLFTSTFDGEKTTLDKGLQRTVGWFWYPKTAEEIKAEGSKVKGEEEAAAAAAQAAGEEYTEKKVKINPKHIVLYSKNTGTKKNMLDKIIKLRPFNQSIRGIIKMYDEWSTVKENTEIVTRKQYMDYLEEKENRWTYLTKLTN